MSSQILRKPLYQTIAEALRERIVTGQFRPGEKIPPIRQVAEEFNCNKLTVQKAFDRLTQQGFIEKVVGSGSYVKYPEKIHAPSGFYDFKTDYPSGSFFPYQQAQRIVNAIFDNEKEEALLPPPAEGDPELIQILSRYYNVPAERMLIISGAQQGLDLVAKVFSAQISDSMLFEDPTYPGALTLFKARNFVATEEDGPQIEQLDGQLSGRIKLFYTMPAVQNPTGTTYSAAKREAVAYRAQRQPFYIVEDDYLGELRPDQSPRFVDICPERTIYIKSLSQTTGAGIRLGFMVVPKDLLERFIYAKFSSDIVSFGLLQKMVRDFIKGGYYQNYLQMIKDKADWRRRRLVSLLQEFPALQLPSHQAGYSLWIKSHAPLDLPHVPWCKGEEFSFSQSYRSYFRLSFMHLDDAAFEQGIFYLQDVWRRVAAG
jgi:DNA-binding transcriptional MocR family regulator